MTWTDDADAIGQRVTTGEARVPDVSAAVTDRSANL